jgi:MYXO-CTERM domain-containing protein
VPDRPPPRFDAEGDATRRTWLANERTWLAWIRTGLAATAVALGIGRVVPAVGDASHSWPYVVIGAGYALLGAMLVGYGFRRRREVDEAIATGRYQTPSPVAITVFAVVSVLLGLGTAMLVVLG